MKTSCPNLRKIPANSRILAGLSCTIRQKAIHARGGSNDGGEDIRQAAGIRYLILLPHRKTGGRTKCCAIRHEAMIEQRQTRLERHRPIHVKPELRIVLESITEQTCEEGGVRPCRMQDSS